MNSEILFRGKRIDDGEWIGGSLIIDCRRYFIIPIFGVCCIDPDGDIGKMITSRAFEVIPETVGQYTGLEDMNDKRIFTNDILHCQDKVNDIDFYSIVEFGNPNCTTTWGFQLRWIKGDKPNLDILCWVEMEDTGAYAEIIGNIHDDRELMEG